MLAAGKAEVNEKKKVIALLGMLNEVTCIKHLAVSQTRKVTDSLCSIISSNLSFRKDTLISNNL